MVLVHLKPAGNMCTLWRNYSDLDLNQSDKVESPTTAFTHEPILDSAILIINTRGEVCAQMTLPSDIGNQPKRNYNNRCLQDGTIYFISSIGPWPLPPPPPPVLFLQSGSSIFLPYFCRQASSPAPPVLLLSYFDPTAQHKGTHQRERPPSLTWIK